MHARVLFAAVLSTVALAAAQSASADAPKSPPAWQLQLVRTPSGAAVTTDIAPQVDCVRADWCVVLSDPSYLTMLDGGDVTTVRAPVGSVAPGGYSALGSLACRSVGDCVATGSSSEGPWDPGSHFRDELSGGSWHLENGSSSSGQVACNAARCVETRTADAGIPQGNVSDQVGDGPWVTRALVTPWQDAQDNGFEVDVVSVTCAPGKASCYGVGTAAPDFQTTRAMFFFRAGDVWKGVPQALPAGADPDASVGVRELSCPSEGNCAGLGTYKASDGSEGVFAERFVDGVLSAEPIDLPGTWQLGTSRIAATGLACGAPGECAGFVETYFDTRQINRSILVRLHDGVWSRRSLPMPQRPGTMTGGSAYAADIACPTATTCVAVGAYPVGADRGETYLNSYRAAAWVLRDGRWTAWRVPAPDGVDATGKRIELNSVDCAGPATCVFTGLAAGKAVYGRMTTP